MKNRFVVLVSIILVILLTGCNLPAGKTQTGTPDYIGTQVATMLTAQPTLQPVVDTPVQSSAQPTNESPTAQPSETSTPTATPTATTSPEDPRVLLGNPTYTDTLDNGKSFGLESKAYDDDYTYIRVENGALVLTSRYATVFALRTAVPNLATPTSKLKSRSENVPVTTVTDWCCAALTLSKATGFRSPAPEIGISGIGTAASIPA